MKFPSLSNLGSVVALAAGISGCDKPDIVADAGVNGVTNEAGMNVTDAGVPEINSQIAQVVEALENVIEHGTVVEGQANYARSVVEDPLIDEPTQAGYEEYNSSAEVYGFSNVGRAEAGISVRIFDFETMKRTAYVMFVRPESEGVGVNGKLYVSIGGSVCDVPAKSDPLISTFDVNSAHCVALPSTTIHFTAEHQIVDAGVDAPDAAVLQAGGKNLPVTIASCSYTYVVGGKERGQPYDESEKTVLEPGNPYCAQAAQAAVNAINEQLKNRSVCSPVNDNFTTIQVTGPESCN